MKIEEISSKDNPTLINSEPRIQEVKEEKDPNEEAKKAEKEKLEKIKVNVEKIKDKAKKEY